MNCGDAGGEFSVRVVFLLAPAAEPCDTDPAPAKGPGCQGPEVHEEKGTTDKPDAGGAAHLQFQAVCRKFADSTRAALEELRPLLHDILVAHPPATFEGKKALAERVTAIIDAAGYSLLYRDGGRYYSCTLRAITGGTAKGFFRLQETKKRPGSESKPDHSLPDLTDGVSLVLQPNAKAQQGEKARPGDDLNVSH
jgi:hypothetical protein